MKKKSMLSNFILINKKAIILNWYLPFNELYNNEKYKKWIKSK